MTTPLSFEDFLTHTTEHYHFMLTELQQKSTGTLLLNEWLTRIVDIKNELNVGEYLDFLFGSICNLVIAFKETKEKFPDEYLRVTNLAHLMWQISDELRIKLGEISPIEPTMLNSLPQTELIEKSKILKVSLFAFMRLLEDGFNKIDKIVDRNVIIQWAGIYYYNYYGFHSLTLIQPGQTQQIKDQFEAIVRKIFTKCPPGTE